MELLKSRKAGALLHWASAVLLLGMLAATDDGMRRGAAYLFAVAAALWVARSVLAGPMARPGAALTGAAAAAHLAIHRGLLTLVAVTAVAGLVAAPALHGRLIYATLALAAVHLCFNLWREASGEKVLRRMWP